MHTLVLPTLALLTTITLALPQGGGVSVCGKPWPLDNCGSCELVATGIDQNATDPVTGKPLGPSYTCGARLPPTQLNNPEERIWANCFCPDQDPNLKDDPTGKGRCDLYQCLHSSSQVSRYRKISFEMKVVC